MSTEIKKPEIRSSQVKHAVVSEEVQDQSVDTAVVDPLANVTHHPTPLNPKVGEHFFCVRLGEEYVCTRDGQMITPYFKCCYKFNDFELAVKVAIKYGGQLYFGNRNHATAKRMVLDFSPLY